MQGLELFRWWRADWLIDWWVDSLIAWLVWYPKIIRHIPQILKKSSKIGTKNHTKSVKIHPKSILGASWRGLGAILGPRASKSSKNPCRPFRKRPLGRLFGGIWRPSCLSKSIKILIVFYMSFLLILGAILASQMDEKSTKNPSKIDPKSYQWWKPRNLDF